MKKQMQTLMLVKLEEDAFLPTRNHPTDAGIDLYAYGNYIIKPHREKIVRTGIAIALPSNLVGLIWPKGRSSHLIGAGVVDDTYRGEILIKVINFSETDLVIREGDSVAQLVIQPVVILDLVEVTKTEFDKEITQRGESGGIVAQYKSIIKTSTAELVETFEEDEDPYAYAHG